MSSAVDPIRVAVALGAELRREGITVGVDRSRSFAEAAALSGDLYWAGRATLIGREEDIAVYDRVFHGLLDDRRPLEVEQEEAERRPGDDDGADPSEEEWETERVEASRLEALRRTAFETLTAEEVDVLARSLDRVARRVPRRRVRRRVSAPTGRLDLRRTVREMHRLGGEGVAPHFTAASTRPQPLTFFIDVSGSMRSAARALLLACSVFVRASGESEAFTFGTHLTRVTTPLRRGPLPDALTRAAAVVEDREGGTRIGDSLAELLALGGHGRSVRGSIVVIYSDGLETGDPALLAKQMERLDRLARRVVWLNPLSDGEDYEPLARGMQASLPFVDLFASGASLDSFERAIWLAVDAVSAPGQGLR
ncbi:MAG: VWA domain-containing protein [Actinobacteria bacterium]|nr:VWA domain-containing protein [Actinomycetota bacterium]